jgi:polyisoprenoid-binding protein YceI
VKSVAPTLTTETPEMENWCEVSDRSVHRDSGEAAKYPVGHYQGTLERFVGGSPHAVVGRLTMHGVTRPVTLHIDSFKCMINPLTKREVCGAEASADLDRSEFGITVGKPYGFRMNVHLRIQVEAIRAD